MFTWICPQCGREVPPAYNDCPNCHPKVAPEGSPVQPEPVVPVVPINPPAPQPWVPSPVAAAPPPPPPPAYVPPVYQQAPPVYQPPPPVYPPSPAHSFLGQVQAPPPPRQGLPTWLMTIVFTLAFLGLGAGIYWTIGYFRGSGSKPSVTVESPAAKPGTQTSPLQKYIEIAGVRFIEDAKKKPTVTFIIINHSGAEIGELAGNVTVWGRTRTSEEEAAGTFSFKTSLGPNQYKELTVPLNTKLKFYELPDWQNVSTDIQITAPATSVGSAGLR
jgi:hypothetical protein